MDKIDGDDVLLTMTVARLLVKRTRVCKKNSFVRFFKTERAVWMTFDSFLFTTAVAIIGAEAARTAVISTSDITTSGATRDSLLRNETLAKEAQSESDDY